LSGLPLAGIRVLDLAPLIPGPFAAQILADLGADVISVEPPGGDMLRKLPGNAYPAVNRNKRGVVLNLKSTTGVQACLRLAAEADVLIEGNRPGVVDRLGVGYDTVRELNPRVVYCSISGYGQSGPQRLSPGHDLSYLAASGLLAYAGHWGEEPRRMGAPVADFTGAAYAVISILALLFERVATGVGGYLDVAIAETATALAALRGGVGTNFDGVLQPHLFPANDVYTCADGLRLCAAAIEDGFWKALRNVLVIDEPAFGEPRYDTLEGRVDDGDHLHELLRRTFATRPRAEWLARFAGTDAPVNAVRTLEEAAIDAQFTERSLVQPMGTQLHVRFPVLRDGRPLGRLERLAPALCADDASTVSPDRR
jgi:crotonobetainyl-CoA:carnitine CoA-transferase CaiB-like acyl-CoA transferase